MVFRTLDLEHPVNWGAALCGFQSSVATDFPGCGNMAIGRGLQLMCDCPLSNGQQGTGWMLAERRVYECHLYEIRPFLGRSRVGTSDRLHTSSSDQPVRCVGGQRRSGHRLRYRFS